MMFGRGVLDGPDNRVSEAMNLALRANYMVDEV